MRPDLGVYNRTYMHSPNFDALAASEDAVVFDNANVYQAICCPSRTSTLTGRRPDSTHVWNLVTNWRLAGYANATSVFQYFLQQGFAFSGGQGKTFHPVAGPGGKIEDIGFSWNQPYFRAPGESKQQFANFSHAWWSIPASEATDDELPDGLIATNAVEMLKNATSQSGAWVVAAGFHRPHLPEVCRQPYTDLYPLQNTKLAKWPYRPHGWGDAIQYAWDAESGPRHMGDFAALNVSFPYGYVPEDWGRQLRRAYHACVSFADRNVGVVLDALKSSGQWDDTTIIAIGDHGWQLSEHGEYGKKTNFQEAVIAPMILKPAKAAVERLQGLPRGSLPPRQPPVFLTDFAERGSAYRLELGIDSIDEHGHVVTRDPEDAEAEAKVQEALQRGVDLTLAQTVRSEAYVEFVSIYPTLAELSGIPVPPVCPDSAKGEHDTAACIDGVSFARLLAHPEEPFMDGAFAQYPTCMHDIPPWNGCENEGDPRHMGYTVQTRGPAPQGTAAAGEQAAHPAQREASFVLPDRAVPVNAEGQREYRFTQWLPFNHSSAEADWDTVLAVELYDHSVDPTEDYNVAAEPAYYAVVQALAKKLRAGWRAALPSYARDSGEGRNGAEHGSSAIKEQGAGFGAEVEPVPQSTGGVQPPVPGDWVPYEPMWDEFDGDSLNESKWNPRNVEWEGRQPGWFDPANVKVQGGNLQLWAQHARLNASLRAKGYDNFTTAAVQSTTSVSHGLFTVRYRSGSSAVSSSWWFSMGGRYDPSGWGDEIDMFESSGTTRKDYDGMLATHVHVWKVPQGMSREQVEQQCNCTYPKEASSTDPCSSGEAIFGGVQPPSDAAWHVNTLLWNSTDIMVFEDGQLKVHRTGACMSAAQVMNFDRETMGNWFGLPDPSVLPDQPFEVDYVRAWKPSGSV